MDRDLVVFSHLRWTWVWQRPQHLVSRLAVGRRVWFVEDPQPADVTGPVLRTAVDGPVTRVWLDVPDQGRHVGFEDGPLQVYADLLPGLVGGCGDRVVWLYSPLPFPLAGALGAKVLVYDVMDDLTSFLGASQALVLQHQRALREADVVFAGGRTLHRNVAVHRRDAWLFPSGVEPAHYARAEHHRRRHLRPVAGYVGVIDERLDLDLIARVAAELPDWDIELVGPVAKIDEASLPTAANLHYRGPQPYERLPEVMGGFDVAMMPFALNAATRSISPTKTLEYLAARLPVVSTPVADVVADFGHVVTIAADPAAFVAGCRDALTQDPTTREARLRPLLTHHHWDTIAQRMTNIINTTTTSPTTADTREASA
jgi:glycosyltransferase involved in cell wall biosynthesis